ncbi:hypothetical protein TWF569_003060 [Orbilia oligospora]|uniref:WSC domain-containing protein n=1 Tax=Orbilia oligospora TaxID=2813651 RepID=A0A7C8NLM7_ORBOL|nr:hypothetical protein TWF102_009683 [Orbilia oligospora]KAF3109634.1 hypothetical protein TWF103_005010 [Orbilia oligospora]KAF3114966.1 hypothetical protein TWF706_007104 [Orbilia oligospora]KAF3120704.1 hypothetical protein TWF569_003060 [Orbilia oligospora]KAF3121963.1 hypothetical protein TWF703_001554 [Orbilia oligospora]
MPSLLRTTLAAFVLLGAVAPVFANDPSTACYDNPGDTKNYGIKTYQTANLCLAQCRDENKAVYGVTRGSTCYCGDVFPEDGKVDMSECNVRCQGFPDEICGGVSVWSFGITGVVPPSKPKTTKTSSTSSSESTSSEAPSIQTVIKTPIVTQTAPADGDKQQNSGGGGGSSKAGIAAGVVVGVIAVIAMGVGGFLIVRRNRRRQAEEEYRAAVAAKEFTASIRKPQADTRLDPVMLQRRMSDGSIADNQDYSRRILKVTNPDA